MSDAQQFLLVLILFYVCDCISQMGLGSVAFVAWPPWRWRVVMPRNTWGRGNSAIVFAGPLPPLGSLFVTSPWPLSLSPKAISSHVSLSFGPPRDSQTSRVIPIDAISEVESSGMEIMINGNVFAVCAMPDLASELAELISSLRELPEQEREPVIVTALSSSLDTRHLHAEYARFLQCSRGLRISCNLLWCYIFLLCPLLTWHYGFLWMFVPLVLGVLFFHVPTLVLFSMTHRRLYPEDSTGRRAYFLKSLLCPPMAIRALDVVSKQALARFHPLAVAQCLCPHQSTTEFARGLLLDLRYPLVHDGLSAEIKEVDQWYRDRTGKLFRSFLEEGGMDVESLLCPPAQLDKSSRSYCPRCRCIYTLINGTCTDCRGVELVPFGTVSQ